MSRKPVPKWTGTIDAAGKLRVDARELFLKYLLRMKNSSIELVIRKRERPKSQNQLGYLWGVIYPVAAEHFGYLEYEVDAVHDACMRHLRGLKPEPNPLQLRVSLKDYTHEETSAYISDLRFWLLTEHGCTTPDANAVDY